MSKRPPKYPWNRVPTCQRPYKPCAVENVSSRTVPVSGLECSCGKNFQLGPGARFSKVPVTSGPDNLSGPLSGNFIGPDVAFLEAPVNFPGNFRAR